MLKSNIGFFAWFEVVLVHNDASIIRSGERKAGRTI